MAITQVTRRALSAAIESCGYWWAGDLNEVEFLSRLYPLDDLASTDTRFRTAREDITQHCIANCDWQGCWVLEDERFELAVSDERLLRFLAETVHPEVRADLDACRQLASMYNSHLRLDGLELAVKSYISGRPVFGPARASPPEVTPLKLQEAIAEVIWGMSATRVADYCEGLGLGPPRDSYDDPMSSKRAYVMGHTKGMSLADRTRTADTGTRRQARSHPSKPRRSHPRGRTGQGPARPTFRAGCEARRAPAPAGRDQRRPGYRRDDVATGVRRGPDARPTEQPGHSRAERPVEVSVGTRTARAAYSGTDSGTKEAAWREPT